LESSNEKFARDYLDNMNPVGRFFYFGDTDVPRPQDRVEIVGVCKDVKYDRLRDEAPPTVYISYLQHNEWDHGMAFEARTAMPPIAIGATAEKVVGSMDRNVPVAEIRTQEEQIRDTLGTERMFGGW
jgi:hypothetical protein